MEDYTKAIDFDPKDAHAYAARGDAYGKKASGTARSKITPKPSASIRKMLPPTARAVLLTTVKEITTARSKTIARRSRLMAKALPYGMVAVGCVQLLANCSRHYRIAISLQPNDANARDSRAFVYLKMGKVEDAIADYKIALGLNPSLAASLYGRGVAKLKKGDTDSGNSDIESAKRIERDIADKFQRYGIQLTQLSHRQQGSEQPRSHRSR